MKKPLFSAIYVLSLLTAGLTIHQAYAQRGPAVEPLTEVSIETNKPTNPGFNFADQAATSKRIPANIVAKSSEQKAPYSFIGPLIFLLALPLALWIIVSKKIGNNDSSKKFDYYPKTFQFKPYKTDDQIPDIDDDDQHFPKAS